MLFKAFVAWSVLHVSVLASLPSNIITSGSYMKNRNLEVGDFAAINEVFGGLEVSIDVAEPIVIGTFMGDVTVNLSNLICRNIDIGDMDLAYDQPEETSVAFRLNVIQFDIECSFDYAYNAPLGVSGAASALLVTDDSSLSAEIVISQEETSLPPNSIEIQDCVPSVQISNIDFQGGIVASILNLIESSLRGTIADRIKEFLCDYISDLEKIGGSFLSNVSAFVEPYLLDTLFDMNATNPELGFKPSPDINLINFKDPEGLFSVAVVTLMNEATSLLGEEQSDQDSPSGNGLDLGINILIRDFLLNKDRAFAVNTTAFGFANNGTLLEQSIANISDIEIKVERIRLQGLDTFTRFDPIEFIGNHSLRGSFAWDYVNIEMWLYISIGPSGGNEKVEETIKVSTRIENLEFSFSAFVAINADLLGALSVSHVLDPKTIIPCLSSAAEELKISLLNASFDSISNPKIRDFESPGLARVLEATFEGLYTLLDDVVINAVPGIFQVTIRDLVNEEIDKIMKGQDCKPLALPKSGYVDFRDLFYEPSKAKELGGSGEEPYGFMVKLLRDFIDTLLLATDTRSGLPKINTEVIAPLTNFLSGKDGSLFFNVSIFQYKGDLSFADFKSKVNLKINDLKFENLDSIGNPLKVLEPTSRSGYELNNFITAGLEEKPLIASARVMIEVQGEDINLSNKLDISLNLVEAQATLLFLIKMLIPKVFSLPLISLSNINCWLASIPAPILDKTGFPVGNGDTTIDLIETAIVLKKLFLNITCVHCSSPGIEELADRLMSKSGSQAITDTANFLFEFGLSLLDGGIVEMFIAREVNDAPARCPTDPAYDPKFKRTEYEPFEEVTMANDSIMPLITMLSITLGIVFLFSILHFIIRYLVRRRHRTWLDTLPEERILMIHHEQGQAKEKEKYLCEATTSMFTSKDIPVLVRYGIPIMILGNIGLFLSGHISIGGAVSVFLKFAGEQIEIKDVLTFSIAQSTIDLWNAGSKELAILIFVFSGIWPYTRQILIMVSWFVTPRQLSVSSRESLLIWLDILAKWSSADIFVLIVSLAAFNVRVTSPNTAYLPENFYDIELMLVPLWGLYANLLAQLVSQVGSHIIIHYHRKVIHEALNRSEDYGGQSAFQNEMEEAVSPPETLLSNSDTQVEKLYEHHYLRPHRGINDNLTVRAGVNYMLIGSGLTLSILTIVGCLFPSFSFEQLGLLGVAIEIGLSSDIAINSFSVFDIAKTLMSQGRFLGTAGAITGMSLITIIFIITILIVPLVQAAVLLYQWFWPLKAKERERLKIVVEILAAWQYVDVFIIAVIISAWQLGPTSGYLVNAYCSSLSNIINGLVFSGALKQEDAQCFKLRASIDIGCYILIVAAFILIFLNIFISKALFQFEEDKITRKKANSTNVSFSSEIEIDEVRKEIKSIPVLFSDTFRWLLTSHKTNNYQNADTFLEEPIAVDSPDEYDESKKSITRSTYLPELIHNSSSDAGNRRPSFNGSDLASYGYATDDSSSET